MPCMLQACSCCSGCEGMHDAAVDTRAGEGMTLRCWRCAPAMLPRSGSTAAWALLRPAGGVRTTAMGRMRCCCTGSSSTLQALPLACTTSGGASMLAVEQRCSTTGSNVYTAGRSTTASPFLCQSSCPLSTLTKGCVQTLMCGCCVQRSSIQTPYSYGQVSQPQYSLEETTLTSQH